MRRVRSSGARCADGGAPCAVVGRVLVSDSEPSPSVVVVRGELLGGASVAGAGRLELHVHLVEIRVARR